MEGLSVETDFKFPVCDPCKYNKQTGVYLYFRFVGMQILVFAPGEVKTKVSQGLDSKISFRTQQFWWDCTQCVSVYTNIALLRTSSCNSNFHSAQLDVTS